MGLHRVQVGHLSGLLARPKAQPTGPECILCSHKNGEATVVQSEELVEYLPGDGKPFAKVLIKCHGQEQLATFDMGTAQWTHDDLRRVMGRHRWFDPKAMASRTEER